MITASAPRTDRRPSLERQYAEFVARRLPLFALAWFATLVAWGTVLVLGERARLGQVGLSVGVQVAILLAIVAVGRRDALRRRLLPVVVVGCVLLGLSSSGLFVTLGEQAENAAFVLLMLHLMAALFFAWGWRAEAALLGLTFPPLLLAIPAMPLGIAPPDFVVAFVLGTGFSVAAAEFSWRTLRVAFVRRVAEGAARRALAESRDAYRDLAEHSPDLIYVFDIEGRFTYVNEACARFFHVPASAMVGRSYRDVMTDHPANPDVRADLRNLVLGEPVPTRRVEVRAGDRLRWIESRASAIFRSGGKIVGLAGVARDITRQKLMEDAVRESDARFRSAFQHAAVGVAVVGIDLRFLQVNASLCDMLGYEEGEFLAMTVERVVHADDLVVVAAHARRLLAGEVRASQLQQRCLHKLGHAVWCAVSAALVRDALGRPLHFVVQIQSIAERKRVEEALRASEERYRGLVESQHDVVSRVNRELCFTFVNEALCATLGRRREELLGTTFTVFVHPEDLPATMRTVEAALVPPYRGSIETRVLTVAGWRWIAWEGSAITNARGEVVEIQSVGRDVTARRLAEEELQASIEHLARSEERLRRLTRRQAEVREEERKRLGFDLHDDVCQELVGIGILVEAVRRKLPPVTADTSAEFDRIVRYLNDVVDHLRLLARDLRPMQLRDLGLKGSLGAMADGVSSPATVVTTRFATPIPRLDERVELGVYRIAQEAVANAVRHAAARRVVIALGATDGMLRLEVRDDGRGFRLAERHGSRALGLASMEERALALGAHLDLWSEPGRGTVVSLACPLDPEAPASAA